MPIQSGPTRSDQPNDIVIPTHPLLTHTTHPCTCTRDAHGQIPSTPHLCGGRRKHATHSDARLAHPLVQYAPTQSPKHSRRTPDGTTQRTRNDQAAAPRNMLVPTLHCSGAGQHTKCRLRTTRAAAAHRARAEACLAPVDERRCCFTVVCAKRRASWRLAIFEAWRWRSRFQTAASLGATDARARSQGQGGGPPRHPSWGINNTLLMRTRLRMRLHRGVHTARVRGVKALKPPPESAGAAIRDGR